MEIQQAQALLLDDMRTRMAYLIAEVPVVRKAENLRDIARLLQAVAVCKLIDEADVTAFREYLIRSGQSRRYYLRTSRNEHNDNDRFLGLSRVESVFDALVAGDVPLAREIVALSIDDWHADWEYEDDFCYYLFIHRVIAEPNFLKSTDAISLLMRFQAVLEGQASARLALCRALLENNIDDFRHAFERLLEEYAAYHDERRAGVTEYSGQASFWPRSFVCIEALAWLFMGDKVGLVLSDQYLFCPQAARGPFKPLVVEDMFAALDVALRAP